METLIEEGTPEDLMNKFVLYQTEGYLTPYGKMFDIGIATQQAISRFLSGMPASQCGGKTEMDNGNGGLMRISPLIGDLLNELDKNKHYNIVKKWAEITHAHPRSLLGCYIYISFLFGIRCNKSLKDALIYAIENIINIESPYNVELDNYRRILDLSIIDVSRDTIQSSGYIVDTLEAAIWCLFNTDNYKDAVLAAVNLGGDSDTIGFITGTLAGMYYKIDGIPVEWIDQLANRDMLFNHIEQFIQYYINKDLLKKFGTLDPLDFETSKKHQLMLDERRSR